MWCGSLPWPRSTNSDMCCYFYAQNDETCLRTYEDTTVGETDNGVYDPQYTCRTASYIDGRDELSPIPCSASYNATICQYEADCDPLGTYDCTIANGEGIIASGATISVHCQLV